MLIRVDGDDRGAYLLPLPAEAYTLEEMEGIRFLLTPREYYWGRDKKARYRTLKEGCLMAYVLDHQGVGHYWGLIGSAQQGSVQTRLGRCLTNFTPKGCTCRVFLLERLDKWVEWAPADPPKARTFSPYAFPHRREKA